MLRRPPRSTLDRSSAASDVYKRQDVHHPRHGLGPALGHGRRLQGKGRGAVMGLLAWITLLPLFGAGLCMLVPREEESIHRGIGLLTAIVTLVVSLLILPDFDSAQAGFQLQVDKEWIAPLGIRFHLGTVSYTHLTLPTSDLV